MLSLFIGRTYNSLKEIKFSPNDEITLKPLPAYTSTKAFIKKERKRDKAYKSLALYRIIIENGVYKSKNPNLSLSINYSQEEYNIASAKLLDMVSNNPNYITKPLKIKIRKFQK